MKKTLALMLLLAGLTVEARAETLIWNGTDENHVWNKQEQNQNWLLGDTPAAYEDGKEVEFNDSASGTIVQLNAELAPASVLVTNSNGHNYTFAGDGSAIRLHGTGNLAFSGYTADSDCEFRNALVIDSPGDIDFAGQVTFADNLTITGAEDRTIRAAQMMTFHSGADINVEGNVNLQLAGIESVDGSPVRLRSTGNMDLSGYTADSDCIVTAALALDSPGRVTLDKVSSAGALTVNAGYGIFGRNVTSPQIIANSANADVFLNADTYDLSGSSWNSFVVDLEPIQDGHGVTVHDISVNPFTGRVVVRALSDQLLLGGAISGAALEFYSPGDIMKGEGVSLSSEYPFIDVWRELDPTVYLLDMEALRGDLAESFIWFVDDSYDNASQNGEDARKMRRKAAGETEILTMPELRFFDRDGNTVSREQYANLITNK